MQVMVKVFGVVSPNYLEEVVERWLAEKPVEIVATSQSQDNGGIYLTVFYKYLSTEELMSMRLGLR